MSRELIVWRICYVIAVGILPFIVMAYLIGPRRRRIWLTRQIILRAKTAIGGQDQDAQTKQTSPTMEVLRQSVDEVNRVIEDFYGAKNYFFPTIWLTLVVAVGFFLLLSTAYPLYRFEELDDLLMNIPAPVLVGFVGAFLYALYSLTIRYRTSDIRPSLLFELSYQIIIGTTMAYFITTPLPSAGKPLAAFAVAFVPYVDLITWIRRQGRARLSSDGAVPADQRPSTSLENLDGMATEHFERLAEEDVHTVQNLAMANPLTLYLATAYPMSLIIDWIDQAYLRMYVKPDAASKLAAAGMRGAIEVAQVEDGLSGVNGEGGHSVRIEDSEALYRYIASATGTEEIAARYLVHQLADDPQVRALEKMWNEFGGT